MADMDHICFSDECQDVPVNFQLLVLSHQIYVWIGVGSPKLGNLCIATPTRLVRTAVEAMAVAKNNTVSSKYDISIFLVNRTQLLLPRLFYEDLLSATR